MVKDLQQRILQLKKEKDIAILAHSYQSPDILEIADVKGDSYLLSVAASKLANKTVIMCGVRFMAETVKMMSPEKTVILPVEESTCPMAEQIDPKRVIEFKEQNPDYIVMAYVNTTAELKAVSDICVTSSSALKIARSVSADNILFIPDKNLGGYIKENVPEKNVVLWDGCCPVHNQVTVEDCINAKKAHPNAKVLMHPELPKEVVAYADLVGSTAAIIDYAMNNSGEFIIGTEIGVKDYLSLQKPDDNFYLLSKKLICPDMRITNLTDVYNALAGTGGVEVVLDEELRKNAKKSIDEMIRLGE